MSYGALSRINTNVQSLRTQFALNNINEQLSENQLKLATGLRINSAEDDAAGFSIASKLTAKLAGLNQAGRNIGNAKSMLKIAESGMNSVADILVEMKAKATQAATGSIGETERGYIADQLEALADQINTIAEETNFGGTNLLGAVSVDKANSTPATLSNIVVDTTATYDGGDIQLEGKTVKLDNLAEVDADGTVTEDEIAQALEKDIADTFGSGKFSVASNNTGEITITANDLSVETITISDANDNDAVIDFSTGTSTSANVQYTSETQSLTFQVGEGSSDQMTVGVQDLTVEALFSGVDTSGDVTLDADGNGDLSFSETATAEDFQDFLKNIDSAIEKVSSAFTQVGIDQSQLNTLRDSVSQSVIANNAARSRIQDANFAKVQSETIKLQIRQQTAIAALSQANSSPRAVLGFLR